MSARAYYSVLLLAFVACNTPAPPPSQSSAPASPPVPGSITSAPVAASASGAPSAAPAASVDADASVTVDITYVPTPQKIVDKMLEVAKVKKDDVVYDLGCGDGRIVVSAAKKFGARGFGFDIDPKRVAEANENVKGADVGSLVSIKKENVFAVDLSQATVVTLYLLPELNVRLMPQLEKMKPGSRIVSHDFDMKGAIPDGHWTVSAPEFVNAEGYSAWKGAAVPEDKKNYKERTHEIYLWTIPLKKDPKALDAGAAKPK